MTVDGPGLASAPRSFKHQSDITPALALVATRPARPAWPTAGPSTSTFCGSLDDDLAELRRARPPWRPARRSPWSGPGVTRPGVEVVRRAGRRDRRPGRRDVVHVGEVARHVREDRAHARHRSRAGCRAAAAPASGRRSRRPACRHRAWPGRSTSIVAVGGAAPAQAIAIAMPVSTTTIDFTPRTPLAGGSAVVAGPAAARSAARRRTGRGGRPRSTQAGPVRRCGPVVAAWPRTTGPPGELTGRSEGHVRRRGRLLAQPARPAPGRPVAAVRAGGRSALRAARRSSSVPLAGPLAGDATAQPRPLRLEHATARSAASTISGPGTTRPKLNDDIIAIATNTQTPITIGHSHGWSGRTRSPSRPCAAERSRALVRHQHPGGDVEDDPGAADDEDRHHHPDQHRVDVQRAADTAADAGHHPVRPAPPPALHVLQPAAVEPTGSARVLLHVIDSVPSGGGSTSGIPLWRPRSPRLMARSARPARGSPRCGP